MYVTSSLYCHACQGCLRIEKYCFVSNMSELYICVNMTNTHVYSECEETPKPLISPLLFERTPQSYHAIYRYNNNSKKVVRKEEKIK